jgi:hypothetical protein
LRALLNLKILPKKTEPPKQPAERIEPEIPETIEPQTTQPEQEKSFSKALQRAILRARTAGAGLIQKSPALWEKTKEILEDKAEVGTRITTFKLLDSHKNTFLGSIDFLKSDQNYMPFKFFANWFFNSHLGMELTWDQIRADTITISDGHTDGIINLSGPIISVIERKPVHITIQNRTYTIVPYIGAGLAFMGADFQHEGWWHHGFGGENIPEDPLNAYAEWIAQGSPEWPNEGYRRTMHPDNATGFVLSGGCSTIIASNLSVDFYLRYMNIDVDTEFTLSSYGAVTRTQSTEFPMSNYTLGIGIRYAF